jgi:hypothetical protein
MLLPSLDVAHIADAHGLVLAGLLSIRSRSRETPTPAPTGGYLRNLAIQARARRAAPAFELPPDIFTGETQHQDQ